MLRMTLNRLLILTLIIVSFMLSFSQTHSMIGQAVDAYSRPSSEVTDKINEVASLEFITKSLDHEVFYMTFYWSNVFLFGKGESDTHFHVVRFEHESCSDYCLTAFFMGDISDSGFSGLGYFPRRSTFGDTWRPLCPGCGNSLPMFFEDEQGRDKVAHISKHGFTF